MMSNRNSKFESVKMDISFAEFNLDLELEILLGAILVKI